MKNMFRMMLVALLVFSVGCDKEKTDAEKFQASAWKVTKLEVVTAAGASDATTTFNAAVNSMTATFGVDSKYTLNLDVKTGTDTVIPSGGFTGNTYSVNPATQKINLVFPTSATTTTTLAWDYTHPTETTATLAISRDILATLGATFQGFPVGSTLKFTVSHYTPAAVSKN